MARATSNIYYRNSHFLFKTHLPPPLTLPSPTKLTKPVEEFFTYSLSDLLTAVYDPVATR